MGSWESCALAAGGESSGVDSVGVASFAMGADGSGVVDCAFWSMGVVGGVDSTEWSSTDIRGSRAKNLIIQAISLLCNFFVIILPKNLSGFDGIAKWF